MSEPSATILARTIVALVATVLLTHAFIDLAPGADLPLPGGRTWHADAPIADLAGLLLLGLLALTHRRLLPLPPPPGLAGWGLLLIASVLGLTVTAAPAAALHHFVRKPLLVYLIYGVGLSWAVARLVPLRRLATLVAAAVGLTAAISLSTSVVRIAAGDTLWFQQIEGLTPNHKTLAVCLAGWLPLLWTLPLRRRTRLLVTGLAVSAVAVSLSKTALITTALSATLFLPRRRPLAWRPNLLLPAAALAFALAYYAPVLLQSRTMLDAARARHSLNVRAWRMFVEHPLLGTGSGTSTTYEMATFPHYRINGVDAHGAIQKVTAEDGLLGLLGLLLFVGGTGRTLSTRWRDERDAQPDRDPLTLVSYGALGSFAALHSNLLLSTELYSPTHWVPLATAWGLAHAGPAADPLRVEEDAPCAS